MNFLTEEQQVWLETCHRVMDEKITREYVRECDMERRYYAEGRQKLADEGWFKVLIPEAYGGYGMDTMYYVLMCEAMGKYGTDFAVAMSVPIFTAMNVVYHGSDAQKEAYLRPFMDNKLNFAIAISEPKSGSDAASVTTRAQREGNQWVINGLKQWCSGSSPDNTLICALVRTDPDQSKHKGLSVILIPNDAPGVTLAKLETLARRGTGTNQIFLDDCRVPAEQLLGGEGQGWGVITQHLALERLGIAASYVGTAQQAVNDAVRYAREREQFGKSIFDFQVIRHMIADMQTQVDAARLLTYRAVAMSAAGEPCAGEVAMAKLYASETLQKVSRDGVQILGGHGMLPEADMERYFREGMQSTVGGGTSQIQRTIIAQNLKI